MGDDGTHKMPLQDGWKLFVHTVVLGRSNDLMFQLSLIYLEKPSTRRDCNGSLGEAVTFRQ